MLLRHLSNVFGRMFLNHARGAARERARSLPEAMRSEIQAAVDASLYAVIQVLDGVTPPIGNDDLDPSSCCPRDCVRRQAVRSWTKLNWGRAAKVCALDSTAGFRVTSAQCRPSHAGRSSVGSSRTSLPGSFSIRPFRST